MVIVYLIITILLCYSVYITIKYNNKRSREIDDLTKKEKKNIEYKLKEYEDAIIKWYSNEKLKLEEENKKLQDKIANLRKEKTYLLNLTALGKEKVDIEVEAYKSNALSSATKEIEDYIQNYQKHAEKTREEVDSELNDIKQKLKEYKEKSQAINKVLISAEQNKNEQDTHKIILSEEALNDIEFLLSIESKVNNKEILRKLIWSNYLQKPFNEMIKRLFGASVPKGVIYCIENAENNKKYIGKTVSEVSKRWTEHVKSSLNIGTISHQKIHEVMFGNWTNFTFSIIEVVEHKEEINEREKYYINFFETDKYGYNLKRG